MSVQATTAVWFGSSAKGTRKLVLLAIADCANDEGWAWPSAATLARKCGLESERGIREHVRALIESGEVEESPRPGKTTRYRLRLDILKKQAEEAEKPRQNSAPLKDSAPLNAGACYPGSGVHDTPAAACRTPRQWSADESKGTQREPKEGNRAGENPPSPKFSDGSEIPAAEAVGLPALEGRVIEIFPHALPVLTERERVALLGHQAALALLTPEDWLALRCWFVEADDRIRRQKAWPRDRAEFLDRAGEAIEKVRRWWHDRGRRWWTHGKGREVPEQSHPDEGEGEQWRDFQDFARDTGKPADEVGEAFRDGRWAREFVAWAMGEDDERGVA